MTVIEFLSSLDGHDCLPVQHGAVLTVLNRVLNKFAKAGYKITGEIYKQDRKWAGEYLASDGVEEVRIHIA